jgi:SpoVK/Ycf46/Vps4 family AAA+-type ATPase
MPTNRRNSDVPQRHILEDEFVHLARIATLDREQDVLMFLRRATRRLAKHHPEIAKELRVVLAEAPTRSSPLRRESPVPTALDGSSVSELVRVEHPTVDRSALVLDGSVESDLDQIVTERQHPDRLARHGLHPARAVLLTGPPGVGKTRAAQWISARLGVPLLVLDLSAVMSSRLGRTGANVREVMTLARSQNCVLLLDEIDAIAKRRHDDLDVGELKRLVTVLLQQIDDWPAGGGLIVGATNHPELLDPAAWRRFDMVIEFPLPTDAARREAIDLFADGAIDEKVIKQLASLTAGLSFSDLERLVLETRRKAALGDLDFTAELLHRMGRRVQQLPLAERREVGVTLARDKLMTQRAISEITGLSRDTIRKHDSARGGTGG